MNRGNLGFSYLKEIDTRYTQTGSMNLQHDMGRRRRALSEDLFEN